MVLYWDLCFVCVTLASYSHQICTYIFEYVHIYLRERAEDRDPATGREKRER